jgi:hypothetical protein
MRVSCYRAGEDPFARTPRGERAPGFRQRLACALRFVLAGKRIGALDDLHAVRFPGRRGRYVLICDILRADVVRLRGPGAARDRLAIAADRHFAS